MPVYRWHGEKITSDVILRQSKYCIGRNFLLCHFRSMEMSMFLPAIRDSEIGNAALRSIGARDLHRALGVRRDFSSWLKARIDGYSFIENIDYGVFTKTGENPSGGRPAIEYVLSLDMAKELAMVERTPKGREVRRYFIECERRLRERESSDIADMKRQLDEIIRRLRKPAPPRRLPPSKSDLSPAERIRARILSDIDRNGETTLRKVQRAMQRYGRRDEIMATAMEMQSNGEITICQTKGAGGVRIRIYLTN
jgi:phage anti-repressor protein